MQLLTVNNAKTVKGEKQGWMTAIQYLPSHFQTPTFNTCPKASPLCAKFCLVNAGRNAWTGDVRDRRLQLLLDSPEMYFNKLTAEIYEIQRLATKKNYTVAVRLNGTSDIMWESAKMGKVLQRLMKLFPDVVFYDYTKVSIRCTAAYKKKHGIEKYWLTFSRSETNHKEALRLLKQGQTVAVVFAKTKMQALPTMWEGHQVINGDIDDLRFLDPTGVVVGLRYKNLTGTGSAPLNAEAKQSKFVIRNTDTQETPDGRYYLIDGTNSEQN